MEVINMSEHVVHLAIGVISKNGLANVVENSDMNPLLRHEIILKLGYHILDNRDTDFAAKLLDDDYIIRIIEKTWEVNIKDVDFGMFFIQNITLGNIGYTFYASNLDDINFENILDHLVTIYKTDLTDFGKKFTEHRLRKDVYDSSLIKLFSASEVKTIN